MPDLTVAENVFLGNQPVNRFGVVRWRRDGARGRASSSPALGIDVDPTAAAGRPAARACSS